MVMFWVAILAVSILLYVLLDGFDLGVGILFGLARDETRRHAMLSAVAPMWDGNETWLVVAGVDRSSDECSGPDAAGRKRQDIGSEARHERTRPGTGARETPGMVSRAAL